MKRKTEIIEDEEPITKLTAQLDSSIENRDLSLDNPVNVKEIYTEIDNILMNSNRKKKSNLLGENVKGIIIANWFNTFLVKSLGEEFRLEILDDLINDKLTYIISMDKTGLNELYLEQLYPILPPSCNDKCPKKIKKSQ